MHLRIAGALTIAALVGVAWWLGLPSYVTHERIHALLAESGPWGPLFFVLAFAVLEPFGVPGVVFVIPASLAWPTSVAVALSVLGATGAGAVSFLLARGVLGHTAERYLPARVRRFTETARANPIRTVLVVRLLFFLAAPAHWALSLSGVRFAPFLIGSLIGFTPGMWAFVVFGRAAIEFLEQQHDGWVWPAALAVALAGYFGYRTWFRRPPKPRATERA